jgi:hypothetical protein
MTTIGQDGLKPKKFKKNTHQRKMSTRQNQIMEWYYLLLLAEIEGNNKAHGRQLTSMVVGSR